MIVPSQVFSSVRGRLPKRQAAALADRILKSEKRRLPVNIIFAADAYLEDLNRRFRGKRRPTDVLSFPADPMTGILGEVYLSVDTARRQAAEWRATLGDEILRLVCHGTLHLCGYDHHRTTDAARMRKREDHFLALIHKHD